MQYIRIKEDETGYSYARVFQSCLDGNVEWAEVQDPYIRSKHQVHNFVRFCELVLKNCKRLRRIHLNTGFGDAHTEVRTRHVICLSAPVECFGYSCHCKSECLRSFSIWYGTPTLGFIFCIGLACCDKMSNYNVASQPYFSSFLVARSSHQK